MESAVNRYSRLSLRFMRMHASVDHHLFPFLRERCLESLYHYVTVKSSATILCSRRHMSLCSTFGGQGFWALKQKSKVGFSTFVYSYDLLNLLIYVYLDSIGCCFMPFKMMLPNASNRWVIYRWHWALIELIFIKWLDHCCQNQALTCQIVFLNSNLCNGVF